MLNSVLVQKHQALRVILVGDGSADVTASVVKEFLKGTPEFSSSGSIKGVADPLLVECSSREKGSMCANRRFLLEGNYEFNLEDVRRAVEPSSAKNGPNSVAEAFSRS